MLTPGTSLSSNPRSGRPSGQRQIIPSPPVTIHTSSTVRCTTPMVTCPAARRKLAILARSVLARIRTSDPSGAITSALAGSAMTAGISLAWEEMELWWFEVCGTDLCRIRKTSLVRHIGVGNYLLAAIVTLNRSRHGRHVVHKKKDKYARMCLGLLVHGRRTSHHLRRG